MYYLRTKPAANAIQFTVDKTKLKEKTTDGPSIINGKEDLEAECLKSNTKVELLKA